MGDSVQFKRPGTSRRQQMEAVNAESLTSNTGQSRFFGSTAGFVPPRSPGGPNRRAVPTRPPPPPAAQQGQPKQPAPARPAGPSVAPAPSKSPPIPVKADDYGPKPVPARPAPPRPNHTPRRPGDNLMNFSPDRITPEPAFDLLAGKCTYPFL